MRSSHNRESIIKNQSEFCILNTGCNKGSGIEFPCKLHQEAKDAKGHPQNFIPAVIENAHGNGTRFAFYEKAKAAYAIVATGKPALCANIILKKRV